MPLRDSRTMQGMSYRQSPAETLSGCRHLRCKSIPGHRAWRTPGRILPRNLLLSDAHRRGVPHPPRIRSRFHVLRRQGFGKENTAAGQGVNRSWNRIRRQRLQRRS